MAQPDFSPSAERNKQPILEVMQQFLQPQGAALEIASGTGQHVEWFAQQLPGWTWQPTEVHRGALYNIEVRVAQAELDNVLDAVQLDVCTGPWPTDRYDLIFCANMLHIAPWEACAALMQGSATHLNPGGVLVTYGPYFESDTVAAPSNSAFDESLREHDARWGIRTLAQVQAQAALAGLQLTARHAMPSNNLLLVFSAAADNLTP
jgi:hypothetical protein